MNEREELIEQLATSLAEVIAQRYVRPVASYRLQLRGDFFGFRQAREVVPYLHELGVSHVYCSPYLQARSGSAHGYDIVDHSRINEELGGEAGYREFIDALHSFGLRQILDIVPNHMCVAGDENGWWMDVLENGPSSPFAACFDIDWRPAKTELKNKVLLPVLGSQYGRVLEEGQLQLEFDAGAFRLRCYDSRLPIEPKSYAVLLSHRLQELLADEEAERTAVQELESILTACEYLPEYTERDPERIEERQREKEVIKGRLQRLAADHPFLARRIEQTVAEFNGDPADPGSFDLLDALLGRQVYRLAHWKAASDEINYRRFFDVNELAALCVEDFEVFERAHELVFKLLIRGDVDALRIDHVDGLYDPTEYLCRLQRGYLSRLGASLLAERRTRAGSEGAHEARSFAEAESGEATPTGGAVAVSDDAGAVEWSEIEHDVLRRLAERERPQLFRITGWPGAEQHEDGLPDLDVVHRQAWPLYVVVEKILEQGEQLPTEWPVAGTTGYGFLNQLGGLHVDPAGYKEIVKVYRRFTQSREDFARIVRRCKLLILRVAMSSELQLLAARLNRISEKHRRTRDFTMNNLRDALRELLACFPVYRTYISHGRVSERDRRFIHEAASRAQRLNPALDADLFHFVRDTLLLEQPPNLSEGDELEREFFVGRFQQAASPVMAKGVEDTAFYRYVPLSSLNEVGGDPAHGATGPERFHRENAVRRRNRPDSLISTTTHDTKRTEDTRARISVLSQVPYEWQQALRRWSRLNRRHIHKLHDAPAPSRNDEYIFYQTLIGVWPLETDGAGAGEDLIERLQGYMMKATHEAKVRTSWVNPDPDYDEAVRTFVAAVLDDRPGNKFLPDFRRFHDQVVDWGLYTALAQAFLKLTSPGVPDIYQGQELWDFSLVDPDNRRPVDYEQRQWLLSELRSRCEGSPEGLIELADELARAPRDSRLKLFMTWRTLQFRNEHAALFDTGEYLPLDAAGSCGEHICAAAWHRDDVEASGPRLAIAVAPRLIAGLDAFDEEGRPRPPVGRDVWQDTSISLEAVGQTELRNVFTGETLHAADRLDAAHVLSRFPVALLVEQSS